MSGSGGRSSDAQVRARRKHLLEIVLERGEAEIRSLAVELGVSAMTAHRDVGALVRDQLLIKDRGLVRAPSALLVQTSAAFRLRASPDVKHAVADAALPLVRAAGTVLADDSTSCLPLLEGLAELGNPVTLVTNYLRVARSLGGYDNVAVHLLGGRYVPELDAVFGPPTVDAIRGWHADVAVFSNPAVSGGRLYHMLDDSARVKRAMIASASTRILLLDYTKLGRTAPHVVADANEIDIVVVDEHADATQLAALTDAGARVVVAPLARDHAV